MSQFTILEHAKYLKDAKIRIDGFAYPIGKHIIKLIMYNDNPSTEHWIHEIKTWTENCYGMVLKDKMLFTKEFYFNILYVEQWEEYDFEKFIHQIEQENIGLEKYKIQITSMEVEEKLKKALEKISNAMVMKDRMIIDNILRML